MLQSAQPVAAFETGPELRRLRAEQRFSLSEASARIGVSKAALSQWESGVRKPSAQVLNLALSVYGADFRLRSRLIALSYPGAAQAVLASEPFGPPIEVGQILKGFRIRARRSQVELANRFGIVQSTVAKWESGERAPDEELLLGILAELGASEAEVSAVISSPFRNPTPSSIEDLEVRVKGIHEVDLNLREAYCLLLLRDLWVASTLTPAAESLLAEAMTWTAWHYQFMDRGEEALALSRRALRVCKASGNWQMGAISSLCAARHAVDRDPSTGARAASILERRLQGPMDGAIRGWLLTDTAMFWRDAGHVERAALLAYAAEEYLTGVVACDLRPPFVGYEHYLEGVAGVQILRGYPEDALETIERSPIYGKEGLMKSRGLLRKKIEALWEMDETLTPEIGYAVRDMRKQLQSVVPYFAKSFAHTESLMVRYGEVESEPDTV